MKINIFKVKEGKLDTLLSWCKELSTTHKMEALETLKEEEVTHEYLGVFKIDNQYYAVGFMEGKGLPATDRDLNKKHREIMAECLEFSSQAETAYDLSL